MSTPSPVQAPPPPRPADARPPGTQPPASRDDGSPTARLLLGLALVLGGVVWLLDLLDVIDVRGAVLLPSAVLLVGVALLVLARDRADHGGLVVLGAILTVATLLTAASATLAEVPVSGGVGDRVERPESLSELQDIELAAGSLRLDLSDLVVPARDPGGAAEVVEASVGMGELHVVVPDDLAVRVHAEVGMGEARVLGLQEGGIDVDAEAETPGFADATRRLELRLRVNLGEVEVRS